MTMTESGQRTINTGQFRLSRLQVVNWGTFCDYKDFDINQTGVLFTGPSGAGKSTLLDALSTVLLPTMDLQFNASADMHARGAKKNMRSTANYVRGAWSEKGGDNDESRVQQLREGASTWSAIAATFDDGDGAVTTAVAVKWFTGPEIDGKSLKTMFQLHTGQFDLMALNDQWAQRNYKTAVFKAEHPSASFPTTQESYLRELGTRIGLNDSKSARSLLGKAKAMKDVGDLDVFVREQMLDRPETFDAADDMLAVFTPLQDAYDKAHRAKAQCDVLEDVPANWETYRTAGRTGDLVEDLTGDITDRFLRQLHIRAMTEELNAIDTAIERLDAQVSDKNRVVGAKNDEFDSLDAQWKSKAADLHRMTTELETLRTRAGARKQAYQSYRGHVLRLDRPCPDSAEEFNELQQRLPELSTEVKSQLAELKPQRQKAFATAQSLVDEIKEKSEELAALQSARTLIPTREDKRRQLISHALNIPATDLPYAAELIDVAEDHQRWRPAAEKLLRNFGMRLLVPAQHQQAVMRFIDDNNMRGIVEYHIITTVARPAPAPAQSLASKLDVDIDHPAGTWLAHTLAEQFNHACVNTTAQLEQHRFAVTINGTVKRPGHHYRKDDRAEVAAPSSYILGANTVHKRDALKAEIEALKAEQVFADEKAETHERQYRNLDAAITSAAALTEYSSWHDLDHWASTRQAGALEERITNIKNNDVDLQKLETRRNNAQDAWQKALEDVTLLKNDLDRNNQRQTQLVDARQAEEAQPHDINEQHFKYLNGALNEVLQRLAIDVTCDTIAPIRNAIRNELEVRKRAANKEQLQAERAVRNAIDEFLRRWSTEAPDPGNDVDRVGDDYATLYHDIHERKLPDAVERLEHLIAEDVVPSINFVLGTIYHAHETIKKRVATVNSGLRRVEFNTGTHLKIAYRTRSVDSHKEFTTLVNELNRHAATAKNDQASTMAQFRRVQNLMAKFTNHTAESQQWSKNVLDVRNTYRFEGHEIDANGDSVFIHRNTATNSGGEQEKLVAFCLAAALSYNLADGTSGGRPRFAPLMLDEVSSKSDEHFARQALNVFNEFGFQLLMAAPIRMSGIVEPFIGQAILIDKKHYPEGPHSHGRTATFGELETRRLIEEEDADA